MWSDWPSEGSLSQDTHRVLWLSLSVCEDIIHTYIFWVNRLLLLAHLYCQNFKPSYFFWGGGERKNSEEVDPLCVIISNEEKAE